MEEVKTTGRRRHDAELKRRVLDACGQPGTSVARVALEHGLNANLVHKWRRRAGRAAPTLQQSQVFLPLVVPDPPAPASADIRLEIKRGATSVTIAWPLAESLACAAWLRDVLR